MTKPFEPVFVYRWYSKNKKILYVFDNTDTYEGDGVIIKQSIYKDDKVTDAINKIAVYIEPDEKYYSWIANKSLLFSIKKIYWKGFNINPFNSTDHDSQEINEPISYEFNNYELFTHKIINIVFEKDIPKLLKTNKYYFTTLKTQSLKYYVKHNEKMSQLKSIDNSNVKISQEIFSRINLQTKLKNIVLAEIFDNIHSTVNIDMVQWIDDTSRIMYKLSKKHRISKEYFNNWTNIDKINKINVINLYSILNKNSYCKISIDHEGLLLFNYVLDIRRFTKLNDISTHKKTIIKHLENLFKQSIKLNEISLNASVNMEVTNPSLKILTKNLGEYIDIFHVLKSSIDKNKQSIVCTYKRTSNYMQNIDIYDYIKSRLDIGLSKQEIIDELINLGISGDFNTMVDDEINSIYIKNNNDDKENIKLKEYGTILIINTLFQGYNINITNCPNIKEFKYLLYWLSKVISVSTAKAPVVKKVIKQPSPQKEDEVIPSSDSGSSIEHGSIDFESLGGAKNNYFINMLQNTDKDLFIENYARDKCQNTSQPIVLTKTQKEELEKNNQLHFDNIIKYGSKPESQNYYACPRLWCPQSKVPLSVNDPDAKCPIENEEPIKLFWNNDKNKKRYVKLIKPNDKGMCVPCCMKKEPKEDETQKCHAFLNDTSTIANKQNENIPEIANEKVDNNDENYIMNKSAPIPIGRYGNIPEYLHNILFANDNVKYEACTKSLNKSHPCFVRKGLTNNKYDSIILAIIELLNFKNKQEFIKDVKSKLDIITFISLDNGNICKQFMSLREVIPEENGKLLKELNKFKNNTDLFNIESKDISKLLNIFFSYNKYIEYLSSNDFTMEKKPSHIYYLIHMLYDVNILLFEKIDKTDELFFNCTSYAETDLNPSVCIIIKEGKYYEPIELKMRSTAPKKLLKLNEYPLLKSMMSKCPLYTTDIDTYKKLFGLNNWINSNILKNYKMFSFKTVFINNDLTINKILSKGNVLYIFNAISISFLPVLMKNFNISKDNVKFYDDFVGNKLKVTIDIDDLNFIIEKCREINISLDLGTIIDESSTQREIKSSNTLQQDNFKNSMIIHTNNMNGFYESNHKTNIISKRWYELQKMVVNTIVKKLTNVDLSIIHKMDRRSKIMKLQELFKGDIPHKKKISIILEELPTNSIEHLKKWLSEIIITSKYDYLDDKFIEKDKEFIFSQNALFKNRTSNTPEYLLKYHKAYPNVISKSTETIINTELNNNILNKEIQENLPDMMNGKYETLPSKWTGKVKSDWKIMVHISSPKYNKNSLKEFYDWFANIIGVKNVKYDDVIESTKNKYLDLMGNRDRMVELFQDLSFMNKWIQYSKGSSEEIMKAPTYTPQDFYDKVFDKNSSKDKESIMYKIISSNTIYPNDLHLMSISELLNVSILIILSRSKYTKNVNKARGDIQDYNLSSVFFPATVNIQKNPVLIFYKLRQKNGLNYQYNIIVNKEKPRELYLKYDDIPKDIKILINSHM